LNTIYTGTGKVLKLLKPGEIQELAEQVANTRLEIAAIQETRWCGKGLIKRNKYSLY